MHHEDPTHLGVPNPLDHWHPGDPANQGSRGNPPNQGSRRGKAAQAQPSENERAGAQAADTLRKSCLATWLGSKGRMDSSSSKPRTAYTTT